MSQSVPPEPHDPAASAAPADTASASTASAVAGKPIFEEKLPYPWWMWIVAAAFSVAVGLTLSPTNMGLLALIAVIIFVIAAVLMISTTPKTVVTDDVLRVGRAAIERRYLGEVTGYRGYKARYQRGPGLNGLAYMSFRGWVDPVVKVIITDERDRTPYWLFSTKRPEELVEALGGSMAGDDAPEI